MNHLPRIALGTVQSEDDLQVMLWALLNVLDRSGLQVQSFASQSRCDDRDAALALTGQGRRYLDSWLMDPDLCAELFHHGSRCADIGVVDGRFNTFGRPRPVGGSLNTLCQWLDLPQIAVIDAANLEECQLPAIPQSTEGILVDNVFGVEQLCRLQTWVEAHYGVPVVGSLVGAERLRAAITGLANDETPSVELCRALGNALAPHFSLDKFLEIAARREFFEVEGRLFGEQIYSERLSIAIAHDEAFNCYTPDTFDVLESLGACVNFFSPLRCESLPAGTDVVYLGCGRLERHMGELASNICLKEAIWSHVVSGGRVYAETAGLAYICREIVMPNGRHWPMVGLIPALARCHPQPAPDRPVEVSTGRGSWLFPSNENVRGYLSSKWIIHPDGCLRPLISTAENRHDLVGDYQIVGSRLHLDIAAHSHYLERFFQPCQGKSLNTVT